jgi:60 kDa SS-A/Ro ribonucleoprotein
MANKTLFSSAPSVRAANTHNLAGGAAYALNDQAALAQMVVTGVFNDTFYASAKDQLASAKDLVSQADPEFVAKLAVYSRENAYMKDMPAYLCASLASKDSVLLGKVFGRVIDNGKMLRNFVQIVRSGEAGRRSLGTRPKKLVAQWLTAASDQAFLAATVGTAPTLGDVIRLSHPKTESVSRQAMFNYALGRDFDRDALPENVRQLLAFRKGESSVAPKVPFELLTSLDLSKNDWTEIARNASWTQSRMNLNTFLRHGVFTSPEMVKLVAARLRDAEQVKTARVFPYQLLAAYLNMAEGMPAELSEALQDAMDIALSNVPVFDDGVAVLVDTSGSMRNPVTGVRAGATSKIRNVDVAGLFASAMLRANPTAVVVPFDTRVHVNGRLNPRDSVMTNTGKLAAYGGGGTRCGAALQHLNECKTDAKTVVFVSDNESWLGKGRGGQTEVTFEWAQYKRRVRGAKLVCIDVSPNRTAQAATDHDVLNVGGFSDEVFNVVRRFADGQTKGDHWVREIEKVAL